MRSAWSVTLLSYACIAWGHQGLIESEWGRSDNNRKAKFYRPTTEGRRRLGEEVSSWNRLADAIAPALGATRQEI